MGRPHRTFGELRYTWNHATDGAMPMQTPMRYTGQRFDEAIGLYYYNARYYDPALGRFAQADTIVPDPGSEWVQSTSPVSRNTRPVRPPTTMKGQPAT